MNILLIVGGICVVLATIGKISIEKDKKYYKEVMESAKKRMPKRIAKRITEMEERKVPQDEINGFVLIEMVKEGARQLKKKDFSLDARMVRLNNLSSDKKIENKRSKR